MFKTFSTVILLAAQFLLTIGAPPSMSAHSISDRDLSNSPDIVTPSFSPRSPETYPVAVFSDKRSVIITNARLADPPPGAKPGNIYIRNFSGNYTQAYVGNHDSPTTATGVWVELLNTFESPAVPWIRASWEVVAFRNKDDTQRVGVYLDFRGFITLITFRDFHTIDIERV